MILHIVHDDKFADMAYRAFEDARPGANEFVIIGKKQPLKYIKRTPVRFAGPLEFLTGSFAKTLKGYDLVVLHWLDEDKMRLLRQADKSVKFVWIGWGADYYDLICGGEKLLKPLTLGLAGELKRAEEQKSGSLKRLIKTVFFKKRDRTNIINRIDFFSPPLREDYDLIKECRHGFAPVYVPWNYGSLEDDLVRGVEGASAAGNDILVGNSATATNNHRDVFELLKKLDLKGRRIICPLSYGDDEYKRRIISSGKELFPEAFVPLDEFLGPQDYVKVLSSCAFAVMGHIRQQAGGNIIIMLHLGAKVFLYPQNPWYKFFKSENAFIYTPDDLEREAGSRLSGEQIEHNRAILREHWSREAIRRKTVGLLAAAAASGGGE